MKSWIQLCFPSIIYLASISAIQVKNFLKSDLIQKVKAQRQTSQEYAAEALVDLSNHTLKFEECQFVKEYSDDIALSSSYDTVLTTQRFIIFRLCPTESGCTSCESNFGEYLVNMDEYLAATLDYFYKEDQTLCENCQKSCSDYNGNHHRHLEQTANCTSCVSTCHNMKNMENEGYIDATKYLQCTKIYDGGKNGQSIYFGPSCVSSGKKIQIDVFSDRNCLLRIDDKTPEDYLQSEDGENIMQLSYIHLQNIFHESSCIPCNVRDDRNEDHVCSVLYEEAGKCETKNGFNGITEYSAYYANQIEQENVVCDYISSLKSGTYSQEGEIVIAGENTFKKLAPTTTALQKFALTVFFLGTIALITYASILHSELTQNTKVDLAFLDGHDAPIIV